MARARKKNKNLQDAKAAASNPGDAGTDPPKLRLTILLPKKAKKLVTSPEPEGSQSAMETTVQHVNSAIVTRFGIGRVGEREDRPRESRYATYPTLK
jgi:hypothetical protein